MTKHLYIIAGPSGSGKSTLSDLLLRDGYTIAKSYTTRSRRSSEIDNYYFISVDEFKSLSDLFEQTEYQGNYYGVTVTELNKSDFIITDMNGIAHIRESYTARPVKVIGLSASQEALSIRLQRRDGSTERLGRDAELFKSLSSVCDRFIADLSICDTYSEVKRYISSLEK